MPTTSNKNLSIPSPGSLSGTWGTEINNNTINPLDLMLGGVDSVVLSSTNYTLNSTEIQNFMVKLSGTLLANVIVRTSCIGFFVIENNTSGSFTVTIQGNYGSGDVGSGTVIGQGSRNFFVADTTAGSRRADTSLFPSGTTLAFYQASAPTGWTQIVTNNDYAMRVVSGTGGIPHAGGGFFGGSTDGHALAVGEMPSHTHTASVTDPGHHHAGVLVNAGGTLGSSGTLQVTGGNTANATTGITVSNSATGGGAAHSHTLSGLSVLDFILCTKN